MRRLLLRPGAIGDCIVSFPALEFLATGYTEVWISSPVVPLVTFADAVKPLGRTGIDLVGVGDLEMPLALRTEFESFDCIVSWYGENRRDFRRELELLNVGCEFHSALPPNDYPGHAIDFFAGQVGAPAGLRPHLPFSRISERASVAIHPFSGGARKNWPIEQFLAFAERLDRTVEWIAGPEEQLRGALRFENLAELGAHLAGAALFVGNDSGISHLAAATGVATLALFGPTDPGRWAPRGENVTVLRSDPLAQLSVDEVLSAANRLLDSR